MFDIERKTPLLLSLYLISLSSFLLMEFMKYLKYELYVSDPKFIIFTRFRFENKKLLT